MIDISRLRAEMRRLRMSQAALAEAVGASPAAIQQILNGKTQQTRLVSKIARALDVTVEWLEGADVSHQLSGKVESNLIDAHPKLFIYLDGKTSISATGAYKMKMVAISSYWAADIFKTESDENNIIIYRVWNNEMAPTVMVGDDIAVNESIKYDGNPDSVWILYYNKTPLIRRLSAIRPGYLLCRADNPTYAPFEVAEGDLAIRGRVVWQGRSLVA